MKSVLFILIAVSIFSSCSRNSNDVKETLQKNPDILFSIIEAHPKKFLEVVNKAARKAEKMAAEDARKLAKKSQNEEFKNPLKPVLDRNRVFWGNESAKITIVEYSDFECPFCTRGNQTIERIKQEYGKNVRVLFKHLPLDFHPNAMPAAKIYESIAIQSVDKARIFHDRVFANQTKLRQGGETWLKDIAKEIGIDISKLESDIKSKKVTTVIEADIAEAKKFGFDGTPGYLINGVSLRGALPYSKFKEIIDRHLNKI